LNKFLSIIISTLFHPVFINLLGVLVLFELFPSLKYGVPEKLKWFYVTFIFASTSIIPLLIVILLKILGKIESITLKQKEERNIPYLVTIIIYIFDYYTFWKLNTSPLVLNYLLACAIVLTAVLMINIFYKVSIHSVALGSLLAILLVASSELKVELRYFLIAVLVLSGLVGTARASSGSHTNSQIYLGYALGLIFMFLLL